ncbi:MAG: hypothetical protein ACK4ON_09085, partial [Bacteroidia bacterium]
MWTLAISGLILFYFNYFYSLHHNQILIGAIIIVLLKTGNTLTQYHVNEIQVDSLKRQVSLILRSIMSGKKIQHYKLDQVSSELVNNVGVIKYFSSSFTLKLIMD